MKKFLVLFASVSLFAACQSRPMLLSPQSNSLLRASNGTRPLVAASTARNGGRITYTINDYRNFLAEHLLNALDQNKDKAIQMTEFARLKINQQRFAEVDQNHDNVVTLPELQASKNLVFTERFSEASLTQALTKFFQAQDLNHDNLVSYQECRGSINLMFDYNGDNNFALPEFLDGVSHLLTLSSEKTNAFLNDMI